MQAAVLDNRRLGTRHYALTIQAPAVAASFAPGQFVMVSLAGHGGDRHVLPRPMAIFGTEPGGQVELVYAVVGDGTRQLAAVTAGERLVVLGPLGNGFAVPRHVDRVLLVGRGIGICSLTAAAALAARSGVSVSAIASFRDRDAEVGIDRLARTCDRLGVVGDHDGSSAVESVERILREWQRSAPADVVLTCGSRRLTQLLVGLAVEWSIDVQLSVEEHMACGLGYCHGCALPAAVAAGHPPLACTDGPVFVVR